MIFDVLQIYASDAEDMREIYAEKYMRPLSAHIHFGRVNGRKANAARRRRRRRLLSVTFRPNNTRRGGVEMNMRSPGARRPLGGAAAAPCCSDSNAQVRVGPSVRCAAQFYNFVWMKCEQCTRTLMLLNESAWSGRVVERCAHIFCRFISDEAAAACTQQ